MKRLTAVVATVATTGLTTAAIGLGMVPALAATQTAGHAAHVAHVAHVNHVTAYGAARGTKHGAARGTGQKAGPAVNRQIARAVPQNTPVRIASQYGSGQYVSVVDCQGAAVPPPVHLRQPNTPINVTGAAPNQAVAKAMATRGEYKTVYTCSVVVQKKVPTAGKGGGLKPCELATGGSGTGASGKGAMGSCRKPVTLNTGFGGEAGPVSAHHPHTH